MRVSVGREDLEICRLHNGNFDGMWIRGRASLTSPDLTFQRAPASFMTVKTTQHLRACHQTEADGSRHKSSNITEQVGIDHKTLRSCECGDTAPRKRPQCLRNKLDELNLPG